jgi:hypothetical protein
MARYRKLDLRTWNDQKFRELTPLLPSGQALWLYLVLGPQTSNVPGLFEASEISMADRLNWSLEDFRKAFGEAFAKGMAKADWRARLVWLPNAPEYNRPESPNVVISWGSTFDELPECPLKWEAFQSLKVFAKDLPKAFNEAFQRAFAKAMPNQKQEQKQEQKGEAAPTKIAHGALLEDWRRDVPDCNPEAFARWIVHRELAGKPMGPEQRLLQARQLAANGDFAAQKRVVDFCIGHPYYSLIPLADVLARTEGMTRQARANGPSKAERDSTAAQEMQVLKDGRAARGLGDFRDPLPHESPDVYRTALRNEEHRRGTKLGAPRFPETPR